ncbi:Spo0E family sporulation regulatory protein-aspartic acid phosphatase [Sporolactobacillus kofuensis]|uniref:Spo0E family sporulation regulatory protein-aspartic acid phosphatase n=1 Tax=Sporolactobacillus kofuensis TaxID=269672 RepID=A0ABW1WJN9_9BACL|nr:aspartyl-phosphate phosphatase Spo0E family protein [Sporolactobacillus kofuensis]MCO7177066.1 aspartyl-phosphate phosphatase Spo0E family protein [Sporolactobacillus kofuensis]
MNKKELIGQIELVRSMMTSVAAHEPLTSPEIQHMSHHLDDLLNQYERLFR